LQAARQRGTERGGVQVSERPSARRAASPSRGGSWAASHGGATRSGAHHVPSAGSGKGFIRLCSSAAGTRPPAKKEDGEAVTCAERRRTMDPGGTRPASERPTAHGTRQRASGCQVRVPGCQGARRREARVREAHCVECSRRGSWSWSCRAASLRHCWSLAGSLSTYPLPRQILSSLDTSQMDPCL
jgi:hypothetical protein